jgi:hypothetical protein
VQDLDALLLTRARVNPRSRNISFCKKLRNFMPNEMQIRPLLHPPVFITREGRLRNGHAILQPNVVGYNDWQFCFVFGQVPNANLGHKTGSTNIIFQKYLYYRRLTESFIILTILSYCGFPQSLQDNAWIIRQN